MGKIKQPNIMLAEIFFKEWQKKGGLIPQAKAAEILNISSTQINKLTEKGILYKKTFGTSAYVDFLGLFNEYNKRLEKYKIPKEQKQSKEIKSDYNDMA